MMAKKRKKVPKKVRECDELLHWAWTVVANAYEGNWELASPTWRDAATTWRAAYHDYLDGRPLPALVEV